MKKILIAAFAILVLIAAACGGSDSGSDNESSQIPEEEAPSSSDSTSEEDSSSVGEDSDGNKKMYNDYNIFENEFTSFKDWDCWNNNYEISYTGIVHRVCFEEKSDLLKDPFFFRNIGKVCPVSCPHTSCNCDGLLKIFKEKVVR